MNPQMDKLSQILSNILHPDTNIRQQSENEIKNLANIDFPNFLIQISMKINNENEQKQIRQLSSTLVKNLLKSDQYVKCWFNMDQNIKKKIKDNILATLASNDIDIRKAAALAIAGICRVEIPNNQWHDLFNILSGTATNENIYIQMSSLLTLGFIFEEINRKDLQNETVIKLLNTYYAVLNPEQKDAQLTYTALRSLVCFIPFLDDFVKDKNGKLVFFNLIKRYMFSPEENIRSRAIFIFLEIVRNYYDYIEDFTDDLIDVTEKLINAQTESVKNKSLCCEMWCSIGDEERRRIQSKIKNKTCYNILNKYQEKLGNIALANIKTNNFNDEGYNMHKASTYIIIALAQCSDYKLINRMIDFISKTLQSNDTADRYAALAVFRALLETQHHTQFYDTVKDSLVMLSSNLTDQNQPDCIKKISALILVNISKTYGSDLLKDAINYEKLLKLCVALLNTSRKEVVYLIISTISNLAKEVKWSPEDENNILSRMLNEISEVLIQLSTNINLYGNEDNIPMNCFFTLGTLGERVPKNMRISMINQFRTISNMFTSTLNISLFSNKDLRLNYQEYICTALTGFLTSSTGDKETCNTLYNNIIESFKQRNDVYEEGISLIGSIANFLNKDFENYLQNFNEFLLHGLKNRQSFAICKASIFCLSDIIRALKENFAKYCNNYLINILEILGDNTVDKELKPACFNVLSDLFLSCRDEAFKSFPTIMQIIGSALSAAKNKINDDEDFDTKNYFLQLREHILETLTCIFQAVIDIGKTTDFVPYVKPIVDFINEINNSEIHQQTYEICRSSIGIMGDFCRCYGSQLKAVADLNKLGKMIESLQYYPEFQNDDGMVNFVGWAKDQIYSANVSNPN